MPYTSAACDVHLARGSGVVVHAGFDGMGELNHSLIINATMVQSKDEKKRRLGVFIEMDDGQIRCFTDVTSNISPVQWRFQSSAS